MRHATMTRWKMEPIVRVHWIVDQGIREGRMWAERMAKSDPYIFCDDDILIMGKDWAKRAVEIFWRHPEYAMLSTLSFCEGENTAKPAQDCEVYDMHAIGQPMLIQKGILKDMPELEFTYECQQLDEYVKSKGFKQGILWQGERGLRHMHLGSGFSGTPVHRWAY